MIKQRLAPLALPFVLVAAAPPHDPVKLRDAALKDDTAWKITEGLTTEILEKVCNAAAMTAMGQMEAALGNSGGGQSK